MNVLDCCTGAVVFEEKLGDGVDVNSVAFCPSGLYFAAGSSTHVYVWSTQTWMLKREMMVGSVHSIAFGPNGKQIVAGSSNKSHYEVCVWNVETGGIVGIILTSNLHNCVRSAVFSDDGKRIILGSEDGRVRVWESRLCQSIVQALHDPSKNVWRVAISRDGWRVGFASKEGFWGTLRIWDAQTSVQIGKLQDSFNNLSSCVSFSPDRRRVVSGYHDGFMRLWDRESSTITANPVIAHANPVTCVAFSFDSLRIISGSSDMTVLVWNAESLVPIGDPMQNCHFRHVAESTDGVCIVTKLSEDYNRNRGCIRNRNTGKIVWTWWGRTKSENFGDNTSSGCIESEIGDIEAAQIFQSCSYAATLLWGSEPHPTFGTLRGYNVYVGGNKVYSYSDFLGEKVFLGSMPGTGIPLDWKYNANTRILATGLGSEAADISICCAVFD